MPEQVLDFGTNAAGISEKVVITEGKAKFYRHQNDASCDKVMKLVHEVGRDGYNRKSDWKPLANVPVILRQQWKDEFSGKKPGQRLASAPCKNMTWKQFYMLKISQYEHSRLRFK